MKIMQIIWGLDKGGAERVVVDLCVGLKKRGHQVSVCCFVGGGRLQSELEESGVPVHVLRKKGRYDITVLFRLIHLFRKWQIEVVNTHLITADLWGRLAAKMAGVPVIVTTEHSADPRLYRSRFQTMLDTLLGRATSKIIAVSKRVREHHLSTQSYRDSIFAVIYNGVDLEKFNSSGDSSISLKKKELGIDDLSAPVIGNIGRLVPQKRQDLFLEVMASIVKQSLRAVGLIVGDGHLRDPLESQVEALGLEQNIIFTGARGDIPELLTTMNVLVMSSEQEGFSVTILEAMASGIPVVATDVGGSAEVIKHGVNGFLHPFGDNRAITESVLKILGDRTLSRNFSAAGKSTIRNHFTVTKMVAATESLYEELLPPTSD